MAVGIVDFYSVGKRQVRGKLLEAQAATTNGTWYPLNGVHPVSFAVNGAGAAFVGTVQLMFSNDQTKPPDSDNSQTQIGGNLTTPTSIEIDQPYQWVKARVSAYTSGNITVSVLGECSAR